MQLLVGLSPWLSVFFFLVNEYWHSGLLSCLEILHSAYWIPDLCIHHTNTQSEMGVNALKDLICCSCCMPQSCSSSKQKWWKQSEDLKQHKCISSMARYQISGFPDCQALIIICGKGGLSANSHSWRSASTCDTSHAHLHTSGPQDGDNPFFTTCFLKNLYPSPPPTKILSLALQLYSWVGNYSLQKWGCPTVIPHVYSSVSHLCQSR